MFGQYGLRGAERGKAPNQAGVGNRAVTELMGHYEATHRLLDWSDGESS